MTEIHYTYGYATFSADYVGYLLFKNYLLTPLKCVTNLKCSLCLYVLPTEWLGYTTLMGAPPSESLNYTTRMGVQD